jgi:hypothetical protein
VRGLRVTEHGGALMGYKAYVLRVPDQHFSVLLTCNLGAINPGPLAHAVAEVFIGSRMGPRPPPVVAGDGPRILTRVGPAGSTVAPDDAALAGNYYSDDLDVTYRVVTLPNGQLAIQLPLRTPQAMLPTGPNAFRAGGMTLRFERRDPITMVISVPRIGEMRLVRQ